MASSHTKSQYASTAQVPLIKSPSLRVPHPVELPPETHPLPESIEAYFVYPFTLEPHVLSLESARAQTQAAHAARRSALLTARTEERERRRRAALARVAPGFDGSGLLVPTRKETAQTGTPDSVAAIPAPKEERRRDVMDDLVDELARLESSQ
ncbi:hypothetical protein PENSPDRAFT_602178 [Peniophora sp. CONT]|nr:hypothetical protein PENSPDRAFT_602178 [Peniophora sp. CONT]